jgi:hypothetical protein
MTQRFHFRRALRGGAALLFITSASTASAQDAPRDGSVLPLPQAPFEGVITETFEGSTQDYPQPVKPPQEAPNTIGQRLADL